MARATLSKAANALILGAALAAPGIAESATFPGPLLGKSIALNWTNRRQQVFQGSDAAVSRSFNSSLSIYISTAGRAFTKESIAVTGGGGSGRRGRFGLGGGRTAENVQAPDEARNAMGGKYVVHFEGGALQVDSPLIAGARRISIMFDAAYTSCTARVIWGREGGTGPIRQRSWITGRRFEVLSIQSSTPSCTLTSGNVLGGE
jgi:hypothetical protein